MVTQLQKNLELLQREAQKIKPGNFYKYSQGEESNYEQALANIARAYIRDTAPSLAQYELGFQLVERSDDNTKAKGVFGFKIGNHLIYVPIFYINGKVYGYDMMFLYKEKLFLPILEGFITQLKARDFDFGKSVDTISMSNKLALPNLMQLKPTTLKWAMDQPAWLRPFIPEYIRFYHYPSIDWYYHLPNLLRKSASCAFALADFLQKHPRWIPVFEELYGPSVNPYLLKQARDYKDKPPVVPSLEHSAEPADVDLFVYIHEKSPTKLSQTELEKLRQQGYLVRDNRKETAIIRRKPNPTFKAVFNATKGGFYHLLTKSLSLVCAYVVPVYSHSASYEHHLKSTKPLEDKPRSYLVIPLYIADEKGQILRKFSKKYGFTVIDRYLVATSAPERYEHDFDDFQDAKDITDIKKGKAYHFFTENLATPPIALFGRTSKAHRGRIVFYSDEPVMLDPAERTLRARTPYRANLRKDDSMKITPDVRFVAPLRGTKVVLAAPWYPQNMEGEGETEEVLEILNLRNELARIDDLINEAVKSADYELRIYKKGANYVINNVEGDYYASLRLLLKHHNLSEEDSLQVLKTASNQPQFWLVKSAQPLPYPQMPQPPGVPPMTPQPLVGSFGNATYQVPTLQAQAVPMPDRPPQPYQSSLPTPWFDQLLQQAVQSGQKEVLDVSVLSNLLNVTSDEDVIESNLKDAFAGLSALGAMRFGIYSHWDLFKERYGEEDLERKEKALRNVFRECGKILLELQQRPVGFNAALERVLSESKG